MKNKLKYLIGLLLAFFFNLMTSYSIDLSSPNKVIPSQMNVYGPAADVTGYGIFIIILGYIFTPIIIIISLVIGFIIFIRKRRKNAKKNP